MQLHRNPNPFNQRQYFKFLVGNREIPGNLLEGTVAQHIRGALQYPERESPDGAPFRVTRIDLAPALHYSELYMSGAIRGYVFFDCLKYIVGILIQAQSHGQPVRGQLLAHLHNLANTYPGQWDKIVKIYACHSYLLRADILHGSGHLRGDLGEFVISILPIFTWLPLRLSLQFIQLCPESNFRDAMELFLGSIRISDRNELIRKGGRVTLHLINRPSRRIEWYMRNVFPRIPGRFWY